MTVRIVNGMDGLWPRACKFCGKPTWMWTTKHMAWVCRDCDRYPPLNS
jgi:hypothetical protein